jgi:hypothetical protein
MSESERTSQSDVYGDTLRHEQETLFLQYRDLARNLASQISKKFHRPYAELQDEAEHILADTICAKWVFYDRSLAKPITWLYQRIYWGLTKYCNDKKNRHTPLPPTLNNFSYGTTPLHNQRTTPLGLGGDGWWLKIVNEVEEEGKELLEIIICEIPKAVREELRARYPQRARTIVARHLVSAGWSDEKIERAWAQVDEVLA